MRWIIGWTLAVVVATVTLLSLFVLALALTGDIPITDDLAPR